ncbi:MAG: GC-type dockerin domain-anchored protein, partial [Phycisphaerales bacterium]|nr:GC-type dockerin domain-anchored protein [Phycisphaerales bacterium]
ASSEGVNCAVVAIGANDFAPTSSAYFNIYWGFWSTSQINSYVNARIANVNTAVTALDSAGLRLIVCNYVDFGVAPATRQLYSSASRRTRVTNAIAQVNTGITGIARQHRAALVDLSGLGTTLLGTAASPTQFLPIGSVNIQLFNRDTSSHSNPLAGFVDDGGHPHTTVQGAFANLMMTAVNIQTRAGLVPFSDAEILSHAGIAYPPGGSDTLDAVVGLGGYTKYIRNFRCLADIGSQGGTAGPDGLYDNNDFVAFIDAFFGHSPAADFGGQGGVAGADGLFDNNDFVVFIDAFFQGCA